MHKRSTNIPSSLVGETLTMLPPISVPTPKGLPRHATRALSPPLLPPGERLRFHGLDVVPNTLFSVSKDWGKGWWVSKGVQLCIVGAYEESLRICGLDVEDSAGLFQELDHQSILVRDCVEGPGQIAGRGILNNSERMFQIGAVPSCFSFEMNK